MMSVFNREFVSRVVHVSSRSVLVWSGCTNRRWVNEKVQFWADWPHFLSTVPSLRACSRSLGNNPAFQWNGHPVSKVVKKNKNKNQSFFDLNQKNKIQVSHWWIYQLMMFLIITLSVGMVGLCACIFRETNSNGYAIVFFKTTNGYWISKIQVFFLSNMRKNKRYLCHCSGQRKLQKLPCVICNQPIDKLSTEMHSQLEWNHTFRELWDCEIKKKQSKIDHLHSVVISLLLSLTQDRCFDSFEQSPITFFSDDSVQCVSDALILLVFAFVFLHNKSCTNRFQRMSQDIGNRRAFNCWHQFQTYRRPPKKKELILVPSSTFHFWKWNSCFLCRFLSQSHVSSLC